MNTPAHHPFVQARELPPAARDAFLAQACGEDAALHLEVQRMLIDAARADSFFGDGDGASLGAQEFQETYAEKEGDVIGPYKLRQAIGEGGFGTVWMAEQSVPIFRMVALKVIKAGMDTKQALARRVLPAGDPRTVEAMKVLIPIYRSVDLEEDAAKLEAELKALPAGPGK